MASIEELKAELERRQASETISGNIVDGESNGVYLEIRGRKFECRRVSVSWHMMRFARAQRKANVTIPKGMPEGPERTKLEERRNEAGMDLMAIMLDAAMVILKPHERDAFESYMDEVAELGLEPGELESAIGNVIAAVGGSEEGKAEESSRYSESSETPSQNVRVISFKPVTGEDALPEKNSSTA